MNIFSAKQHKTISFLVLILMLFFSSLSLAQKNKSRLSKSAYSVSQTVHERPLKIEKYNGNDVCSGRALIRTPKPLSLSEVNFFESFFKKQKIPVRIEQISPANIYLLESTDNKIDILKIFSTLQGILAQFNILGGTERKFNYIPDYLIRGEPETLAENANFCERENSNWGVVKIQAPKVWGDLRLPGNKDTIVAILDHGILDHPDLRRNLWKAPKSFEVSVGDLKTICPAGTLGVNFWASYATDLCNPRDNSNGSHGIKVAGIIGANGKVSGVNKNIKLLPIKVLNQGSNGCVSDAIRGWEFIIRINQEFSGSQNKIIIVNNSFGFNPNILIPPGDIEELRNFVQRTNAEGLLLIASAGNDGKDIAEDKSPHYPASFNSPNLIAVAATDMNDNIITNSNIGPKNVHLAAPGLAICTTTRNNGYTTFSKTSAAAPFVSGAAALVLSACPELTNKQIKSYLEDTAFDKEGELKKIVIKGRVDVFKAVQSCRRKEIFSFNNILLNLILTS